MQAGVGHEDVDLDNSRCGHRRRRPNRNHAFQMLLVAYDALETRSRFVQSGFRSGWAEMILPENLIDVSRDKTLSLDGTGDGTRRSCEWIRHLVRISACSRQRIIPLAPACVSIDELD
jgi:hypothetical protein